MNALIVVAKRPTPGQTKTRLTSALSEQQAARLYECFLLDTLDLMRQVHGVHLALAYLPASEEAYFHQLAPDFELIVQSGEDLGVRLDEATGLFLERGCEKVVIMASDSPTLPASYLAQALEALAGETQVVIGPCDDGGYYLIGFSQAAPRLLREVQMSTPHVTADTLALAAEQGLRVGLLPTWYDIDDTEGLARLQAELNEAPDSCAPYTRRFLKTLGMPDLHSQADHGSFAEKTTRVSVIIPALNEAGNIHSLVKEIQGLSIAGARLTTIVVDNGSSDATTEQARAAGALVVFEPRRGYGYACMAGAVAAVGAELLVFLDGDYSCLPAELPRLLEPVLSGRADLVCGSRELGGIAPGAMPPQQRFGNRLSVWLMNRLYSLALTDLGPYRAMRRDFLIGLGMREMTYGWIAEMNVKAARRKARLAEAPVSWRKRRAGSSKVSGTLRGTLLAGWFILSVTLRYAWGNGPAQGRPRWSRRL